MIPSDSLDLSTIHPRSTSTRTLNFPLMHKRMNSVQKYIQNYRMSPTLGDIETPRENRENSKFSNEASRLLFGGRVSPDPYTKIIDEGKCYVKYSPLGEEKTEDKLSMLNKIQNQYEHLKSNLNAGKQIYTSKYTLPIKRRKSLNKCESQRQKQVISHQSLEKQLKKEVFVEDGKKQFLDLYIMKKDRTEVKDDIQKFRKYVKQQQISDKHKQHEKYLKQKYQKQTEQKRNKMLKNKGLHWNVYYQMLALTKDEKQRLRGSNSSFVATYGTN